LADTSLSYASSGVMTGSYSSDYCRVACSYMTLTFSWFRMSLVKALDAVTAYCTI